MASQFYMQVEYASGLEDDFDGEQLSDLAAAVAEATHVAREILADAIKSGADRTPRRVIVLDASRLEVAAVMLEDVIPRDLLIDIIDRRGRTVNDQ